MPVKQPLRVTQSHLHNSPLIQPLLLAGVILHKEGLPLTNPQGEAEEGGEVDQGFIGQFLNHTPYQQTKEVQWQSKKSQTEL